MKSVLSFTQIATPFVWAGLIIGISFLEAPLKFRAPGITLVLGLGIGKLVFTALNRVELVLGTLLLLSRWLDDRNTTSWPTYLTALLIALLLTQTLVLLPALNHRIELHQQHTPPAPSPIHWYYVGLELIKLVSLLILGFHQTHRHVPT